MKKLTTLGSALTDPHLLGLGATSWLMWRSVLKAAHAETLTSDELRAFEAVSGGRVPPRRKVAQLAVVASRRAGKGRAAGALAVYASALMDHGRLLAPGERGVIACLSPTKAQAQIVQDYARGYFEASPVLAGELAKSTETELRLRNGVVILTLATDYRTLRGRTLLLAVLDEASFLRDETSASPDIETARALLPGLATTAGMLVVLSSPYRRNGLLYQLHRDHFGKPDDDVLVVAGPSLAFNPSLDTRLIEAARASDPEAARSEWDGEFRSDLSQFLDDASIEAAVDHGRPAELPPREQTTYFAFTDPSGGRGDAFTLAIVHKEGERIICDVIRGRRSSDPAAVAVEFAALAREYGCTSITGDNYAPGWVQGAYAAGGVEYRRSPKPRSDLYLEGLPLFTRGLVKIPADAALLRELRLLERRTARTGKDSIDHGPAGHDDYANALFGALVLAARPADVLFVSAIECRPGDVIGASPAANWSASSGYSGGGGRFYGDHPGY